MGERQRPGTRLRQLFGRFRDQRDRWDEPPPPRVAPPKPAKPAKPVKPVERTPNPAFRRSAEAFIAFVDGLVRRPSRSDRGLPLIWLTGNKDSKKVLDALVDRVEAPTGRYRVPFAHLRASRTPTGQTTDIRRLLHAACEALSRQRFGGERLWFRHYALVEWLMEQDLSPHALEDSGARLQKLLRDRHRRRDADDPKDDGRAAEATAAAFGARYQLLLLVVRRFVPNLLFRAVVSGRVPFLGRRYRWFMRQQYLAPQQSVDFLGFAERLTKGVWPSENREQLDRLLVHAFLEDLRRAYARRPWRVEGWRRTAYPMLLIENVERDTDGYLLLQLINNVRNETGRSDPLLAICTSNDGPPPTDGVDHQVVALPHADPGKDERGLRESDPDYKRWAEALPKSRRARVRTAWNLPVVVPDAGRADEVPGRVIVPPKPPWFARRAVAIAVVLALVGSVVAWVGWRSGGPSCLHRPFSGEIQVRSIGGECVGYSDGAGYLFNDQPGQQRLREVQHRIFEQNRIVRDIWESGDRRRPLVTVVYLGTLTGRPTRENEEAYAAEREELEGLAVAQYNGMQDSASSFGSALLRIVVANGGFQMRYADAAVDMIAELAREDPTVVAVVGLVESRQNTAEALRKLNRAGLPLIAPTLSADRLFEHSKLYLQLAPPNQLQATMLADYAETVLGVASTRIYYTVGEESSLDEDLYVQTLLEDLRAELGDRLEYAEPFGVGTSLDRECGYGGMLLYSGRWSEFDSFLNALEACDDNPPAHLVANDSVNRYMANPALRNSAPNNVPLTYVSKSQLGTCERLESAEGGTDGDEVRSRFLRWVRAPDLLSPPRCGDGDSRTPVGERVPLAYDAATMVTQAVERLAGRLRTDEPQPWDPRAINPAAVHAEILGSNQRSPFPGVTGSIRFHGDTGEPIDKRISMLRVERIPDVNAPLVEVFHCGVARVDDDPACRRPTS
jgi:hypothetical protein